MKKSLIALAALSAFATAAQAQSSVTVYGIIDTGYNNVEHTSATNSVSERTGLQGSSASNAGEAASSRLGFRGTEDLGSGLKAHFNVEGGMGQGSNFSFGRAYWVGLEDSKMGQARVGLQDTFTRSNWLAHDQLAFANVVGNLAHNDTAAGTGTAGTVSHTARSVALNYLSPRFNGLQVSLGITEDNTEATGAAKTKNGSGSQVGLNYQAGKFSAGVAYMEATTSTQASGVNDSSLKTKDTSAATSYDLGVAKVAYIYNKRDASQGVANVTTGQVDRTSHAFSASVPVGAKTVLRAGYGFGEYRAGAASEYNGDIKGMQAAVNYNLSKRTMLYGIYGDESRETSATQKIKSKEYSVGVRHSF